jgi:hypothetical protein
MLKDTWVEWRAARDVIFNLDDGPERVTGESLAKPDRKSDGAWPEV